MLKLAVVCSVLALASASVRQAFGPLAYAAAPTLLASSPYFAATYSAPALSSPATLYNSALLQAPAVFPASPIAYSHLIKKRSAPYIAAPALPYSIPTYGAYYGNPLTASGYTAAAPFVQSYPLPAPAISYAVKSIKKRSAPISYLAPTSISHQSQVTVQSAPLITSYSTPIAYSSPYSSPYSYGAYPYYYKK